MPYSIRGLADIAEDRSYFLIRVQSLTKGIVEKDELLVVESSGIKLDCRYLIILLS